MISSAVPRHASAGDAREPLTKQPCPSLIDMMEAPVACASVLLSSGRRIELEAGEDTDRLLVRGRSGEVVLRIAVGEAGPVLSFTSATIDLEATKRLRLAAEDIQLEAKRDLRETIGGTHHTRVAGAERLEAASVELQANDAAVAIRARERIALDGEHIGLNDEPLPAPFVWSAAHEEDVEQA